MRLAIWRMEKARREGGEKRREEMTHASYGCVGMPERASIRQAKQAIKQSSERAISICKGLLYIYVITTNNLIT